MPDPPKDRTILAAKKQQTSSHRSAVSAHLAFPRRAPNREYVERHEVRLVAPEQQPGQTTSKETRRARERTMTLLSRAPASWQGSERVSLYSRTVRRTSLSFAPIE